MAEATAYIKYGQGAVIGNLAYDFNNPAIYSGGIYGRPAERPAVREKEYDGVRERAGERSKAAAVPRTRQGISPVAILGSAFAAALLIFSLMARIELVGTTNDIVVLEQQLEELNETRAKLEIGYESAFNLAEIEEYAVGTLGMQKPRSDQIYYISGSTGDRAVTVAREEDRSLLSEAEKALGYLGKIFG